MAVLWQSFKQRHFHQQDAVKKQSPLSRLKMQQGLINLLRLDTLGRFLAHRMQTSEPKVWEKHDRQGNTFFKVYDPQSDHCLYLSSEDEVRVWLEERYSH